MPLLTRAWLEGFTPLVAGLPGFEEPTLLLRSVIEHGVRWRIGNGASVRIWHDKWVPVPRSFRVIRPISQLEQ